VRGYGRARDASGRLIVAAVAVAMAVACSDGGVLQQRAVPTTSRAEGGTVVPTTVTVPPTSTTLVATTTTTRPPARVVRLAFTGDSMAHGAVVAQGRSNAQGTLVPYDFTPMWQLVAPVVSRADFALCHLETTVSTSGAAPSGFPRFRAPTEYVAALADAGYDGCSTASNHAYDYGVDGVYQTIESLEQHGLVWAGTARSQEEADRPRIVDAAGVRIGFVSATYGLNGFRLPDDQPWLVDAIDVPHLLERARAARAAGAEIVVVSLHCCAEYRVEPTARQVEQARALIESPDVDLVVGHHAHVVQPIERVGDEYIVYGLGNILSNMYDSACCPAASQDGVVVEVTFTEGDDGRFVATTVGYTPTWVDRRGGFVITPVVAALQDPATSAQRRGELEASFARTVEAIDLRGAADAGVQLAAP
jgi:poly-gamma-glutamate synthesis protein (capsule biosynthesis protein)